MTPKEHDDVDAADVESQSPLPFWRKEDVWAIGVGAFLLLASLAAVVLSSSAADGDQAEAAMNWVNPLKPWLAKPAAWDQSPWEAFFPAGKPATLGGIFGALCLSLFSFGVAAQVMDRQGGAFCLAFPCVFGLALIAYVLETQTLMNYYGLSYALWALLIGLVISNTVGTPRFVRPAVRTELYIKTGLVLLGAEILINKLLALGVPGIFVAWIVTPIVLITTFWFGQRILKIESASLNMVISADMSVCGVSAAIATAAACRAKKEELSVAIGLSLMFTVVMMVVMPAVIKAVGMSPILGGAWMGGTIDSTGAVGAAGALLGEEALMVATTVKMIQNILIGFVAFFVAIYWVTYQEPATAGVRPNIAQVWLRFPKFVLGFILASLLASLVVKMLPSGQDLIGAVISGSSKTLRGWFFCLAFTSIGLETNFRELARHFRGGKPLVLYVAGQSLNLCLTLLMAWLMFEKLFPQSAKVLSS